MKKYALHAGYVYSINDNDRHWISARRLAELYRLRRGEWFSWPTGERLIGLRIEDYIHLYPRNDGDYRLPREAGE